MVRLLKQYLSLVGCLLSVSFAFPQQMVSGRVIDANTGHPLPSISVYLDNTSIGATTDSKGEFVIAHIPPAKYKLVASGIGFKTFSQTIDTRYTLGYMSIALTPQADVLQGAVVRAPDPDGWEKWGQTFINVFIGSSPNAKECRLLNHQVLKFIPNDDNTLSVYAEKPLQLHNEALGYDVIYDLNDLTYNFSTGLVLYSGHIFFKDLALALPPGSSKAIAWRQNRQEEYKGSLMHFMRSLYANTLRSEGFEMHSLAKELNREKQRVRHLLLTTTSQRIADSMEYYKTILHQPDSVSYRPVVADSVCFKADTLTAGFYCKDSLGVGYTLKKAPAAYRRLSWRNRREAWEVSQLVFINKRPVYVLSNGFYYSGNDLKMTGYWGWAETAGTFLPYDYEPGQ